MAGAPGARMAVAVVGTIALIGCGGGSPEQSASPVQEPMPAPARQPVAAEVEPPKPAAAGLIAGTTRLQDDVLRQLERARITELRPVGSTSTVFRATLDGGFRAAFKAPSVLRPNAAINEVMAYRLARCLGIDNVPPALLRRVPKNELKTRMEPAFAAQWPGLDARMIADAAGEVEGALIYWIEDLRDLGLEKAAAKTELMAWLKIDGAEPPARRQLAAQLSTLLAFDYLAGNWDRWSGANLMGNEGGEVVYMRDNDAAFAGRIGEPLQRRMLDPVLQTQRYSRGFVTRLRALSRSSFAEELARDPGLAGRVATADTQAELTLIEAGVPPPPVEQPRAIRETPAFDRVFDRRDTLLSHIGALIEQYGEERVLDFP